MHELLREPMLRADNDLAELDDFAEFEPFLKKTIARRPCGS
jgi:hypothetical protein